MRALTGDFSRFSSAFFVSSGVAAPSTRGARNAIRVPSGNHFGFATAVGRSVMRSASPPSSGRT